MTRIEIDKGRPLDAPFDVFVRQVLAAVIQAVFHRVRRVLVGVNFFPLEVHVTLNLAFREDNQLFEYALRKNIVLVSNSTLLATLRTIGYIWRQDAQNKNAEDIAKQAGDMYDKFVGFVEDMQRVGQQLDKSKESWEGAMNKLSTGKGNLLSKANKVKQLGARTTKTLKEDSRLP